MKGIEGERFVLVPDYAAKVWYSPALLLGDIIRLSQRGPCTAPNEYFAKRYNVSEDTIRRGIRKLKKEGMLRSERKACRSGRALIPCFESAEVLDTITKICGRSPEKMHTPYIRKKEYSRNTSGPAPEEWVRPESISYTLEELEALNFY